MFGAQQAACPGLVDGQSQALHRQGIFMAHIDEALVGADGVAADDHAFQDGVGVALHHRPVHEGPGVAFVAVADEIFHLAGHLAAEAPLAPGGEAAAAPAPQAGALHRVDDGLRAHFAEDLLDGPVASRRQVIVQAGGIDEVHLAQDQGLLSLVKGNLGLLGLDGAVVRVLVAQAVQDLALDQGLLDDFRDVLGLHLLVGDLLGPEHHLDGLGAQALAAAFLQDDLRFQPALLELLLEGGGHLFAPHGQAARAATDQNLGRLGLPAGPEAGCGIPPVA